MSGDGHSLDASDADPIDAVYVDESGNVGIGTKIPNAHLHTYHATTNNIRVESGDSESGVYCKDNSGYSIFVTVGNDAIIKPAGTEKLRITQGGKVGIGTTTPVTALSNSSTLVTDGTESTSLLGLNWQVHDAAYAVGIENTTTGGNGLLVSAGNNTGTGAVIANFVSDDSSKLYIREDGRVGIGTTTPSAELDVAGDLNVQGDITWQSRTGYISVSAAAFQPANGNDATKECYNDGKAIAGSYPDAETFFIAPVSLPHGATITKVTFFWGDWHEESGQLRLYRNNMNNTSEEMAYVNKGNTGNGSSSDSSISYADIDNSQYSYYLRLDIIQSMIGYGVSIEYAFNGPH
ncbi:MAG: hypothetical protein ACMUIP_04085 [bacterium]